HPQQEWTARVVAQPLRCATNHLISSTLYRLLAATTTALLETGIVQIKSRIEAGRRAIAGIKQDGSHKSGDAVSMGVEQIWDVGQPSGKRRAQFADLMCLRISTCQNCRVRHHG